MHAWGVAGVILVSFSILAVQQSMLWKNTFTLFEHVIAVYPQSYVAHVNVGTQLYAQGKKDEALREYGKALQIRDDATAYFDVGKIFLEQGRTDEAEVAFQKAIESGPADADAHIALAALYDQQKKYNKEITVLEDALKLPVSDMRVGEWLQEARRKAGMH